MELRGRLPASYKVYVLGGVLRELRLRSSVSLASDVDVVVSGAPSSEVLAKDLREVIVRVNSFEGLKCRLGETTFDVWRIEDHATVTTPTRPETIETLLPNCVVDADAAALDIDSGYLYEYGFLNALRQRRISALPGTVTRSASAAPQAAHLVLLIARYEGQFEIDHSTWTLLAEAIGVAERNEVWSILERKLADRGARSYQQLRIACGAVIVRGIELLQSGRDGGQ